MRDVGTSPRKARTPRAASLQLRRAILDVASEYEQLTVRQLFYQLVSRGAAEKAERNFNSHSFRYVRFTKNASAQESRSRRARPGSKDLELTSMALGTGPVSSRITSSDCYSEHSFDPYGYPWLDDEEEESEPLTEAFDRPLGDSPGVDATTREFRPPSRERLGRIRATFPALARARRALGERHQTVSRRIAAVRRLAIAYHEAGHAWATFLLAGPKARRGGRLRRVEIEDETSGSCDATPMCHVGPYWDDQSVAAVEREVIVILAGTEAENLVTRRWSRDGGGSDARKALEYALKVGSDEAGAETWLRWVRLRTRRMIKNHQVLVGCLADELNARGAMSGRDVRSFLTRAVERAWGAHIDFVLDRDRRRLMEPSAPLPSARKLYGRQRHHGPREWIRNFSAAGRKAILIETPGLWVWHPTSVRKPRHASRLEGVAPKVGRF